MPKWIGIRVSAVLTILGSVVTLLLAASMVWTAFHQSQLDTAPDSPLPVKGLIVAVGIVFAAFALWGFSTAIGTFLRRGWARLSMIIFAVLLVGMGGSALIGITFIHIPDTPNLSPRMMQNIRIGIAVFYGSLTVLGTWWLLLFNGSATKEYFATREPVAEARPLSISLIGWYLLVCSLGTAVAAIMRVPGMFFGIVVTSWLALAVYTAFTAAGIYLGTGLLQLQESARVASIVYFALIALNSAITVLLPGFAARMQAVQQAMPSFLRAGPPQALEATGPLMIIGTLVVVVPIWFLIRRRAAFRG